VSPPPAEAATVEQVLSGEVLTPRLGRRVDIARLPRRVITPALRRDLAAIWRPFLGSRLLVLAIGAVTMLVAGVGPAQWTFDPDNITTSFGRVGNLLAAAAVRWDSVYYLQIAQHGYQNLHEAGFFPLYPLVIRAVAIFTGSFVIAGVLISLVSMLVTLVIVRRLTALDFGERTADLTVRLLAFGPMAVFLSAVYTESLFLALSAGTLYAGRRGRWALAGVLGGLAATARSGGLVLLVPLLIMFFWGPRGDTPRPASEARWRPRYRVTPAVLWLGLIPLGVEAFNLYFISHGFGSGAPLRAQELYQGHVVEFPLIGLGQAALAAWHQMQLVFAGVPLTDHPSQALYQFGALLITCGALAGMFRRLPLAYALYTALGSVALILTVPTAGDPLAGFARYASLRFPLFMFAAVWAIEHRRQRMLLVGFGLLMILATVQFAGWQVVGTPTL
jgi:hypothetical protein